MKQMDIINLNSHKLFGNVFDFQFDEIKEDCIHNNSEVIKENLFRAEYQQLISFTNANM